MSINSQLPKGTLRKVDKLPWESEEMPIEKEVSLPKGTLRKVENPPWESSGGKQYNANQESTSDFFKRGAARTAADVGEGALDAYEWLSNASNPMGHIKGFLGIKDESKTSQVRGMLDKATGGYTKPQSENEKDLSDISKFIGSALGPGAGGGARLLRSGVNQAPQAARFVMNVARNATLGAIGGVSKKLVTGLTGSEGAGTIASIATPLLGALASKGAKQVARVFYDEARHYIGRRDTLRVEPIILRFEQALQNVLRQPLTTERDTAERLIRDEIRRYSDVFDSGRTSIGIGELMNNKIALSDSIKNLIPFGGNRGSPALIEAYNAADAPLHYYGQLNPRFDAAFQQGERAFAAGAQTNKFLNQLYRNLKGVGLGEEGAKRALAKLLIDKKLTALTLGIPKLLLRRAREARRSVELRSAYAQSLAEGAKAGAIQSQE